MSGKRKFVRFWVPQLEFTSKLFDLPSEKNSQFALWGTFVGPGAGLHKMQVFSGYFEEAPLMFACTSLYGRAR